MFILLGQAFGAKLFKLVNAWMPMHGVRIRKSSSVALHKALVT